MGVVLGGFDDCGLLGLAVEGRGFERAVEVFCGKKVLVGGIVGETTLVEVLNLQAQLMSTRPLGTSPTQTTSCTQVTSCLIMIYIYKREREIYF